MPSTRSKAGGGGCGCGAAVAVLRAGVVDDVVKEVRSAWDTIDDERVEVEDKRELHKKKYARLVLDVLVDEMDVAQTSEADVCHKEPAIASGDRDHHAERHCAFRVGHVHVLLTTQPTCPACHQWLVLLAQQLCCTIVVVSGATTAHPAVFVVHPGSTIADEQEAGGEPRISRLGVHLTAAHLAQGIGGVTQFLRRGSLRQQLFAPVCEHCGGEFTKTRSGNPHRFRCAAIIVCNRCRCHHRRFGSFRVLEDA
ncbi:hypothetical protein RI054_03g14500 [Pseudoscourfieldia marina]